MHSSTQIETLMQSDDDIAMKWNAFVDLLTYPREAPGVVIEDLNEVLPDATLSIRPLAWCEHDNNNEMRMIQMLREFQFLISYLLRN